MSWARFVPTTGAVKSVFSGVPCLVGPDVQLALAGGFARVQHVVDQLEELLHHGILSQVVVPRLHQLPVTPARAVCACDLHGREMRERR